MLQNLPLENESGPPGRRGGDHRGHSEFLLRFERGQMAELDTAPAGGPRPRPAGRRLSALPGRPDRLRPEAPAHAGRRHPQGDARGSAHRLHRPRHPGRSGSAARARPQPARRGEQAPRSAAQFAERRHHRRLIRLRVRPQRCRQRTGALHLRPERPDAAHPRHRPAVDRGDQPAHQPAWHHRAVDRAPGQRPHPGGGARPRRSGPPEIAGRPDRAAHLPSRQVAR